MTLGHKMTRGHEAPDGDATLPTGTGMGAHSPHRRGHEAPDGDATLSTLLDQPPEAAHFDAGQVGAGQDTAPARSPLRGRRRMLALLVVAALLLGLGAVAGSFMIKSPAERAAETGPPPRSILTTRVERRVVQDTVILQGQIISPGSTTISPQVSQGSGGASTSVVTSVRVRPGQVVSGGRVLAEVSGRPVFLLQGSVPVYRDLKPGDDGPDVRQLQLALAALGHSTHGDRSGHFGTGTKLAVLALYARLGYDAPLVGGPDNQDVANAEQAVRQAQRAYALLVTGGSQQGAPGEPAGSGGAGSELHRRYALEDLRRAQAELARVRARTGPMVPASEVAFVPSLPARIGSLNAQVGNPVASDMLVVVWGRLIVQGMLRPYQREQVKPRQQVRIFSDDTGQQFAGQVTSVAAAPVTEPAPGSGGGSGGSGGAGSGSGSGGGSGGSSGDGGSGEPYYPVTITTRTPLPAGLQGLTVRVTVASRPATGATLAVPSSAVSARPDGTTVVTVRSTDGRLTVVPVTTGASGDGYVEIAARDGGVRVGDEVVVGQ